MSQHVLFGEEAKSKLKAGSDKVVNAVKITLGPRGRNVAIGGQGNSIIANDAGTIARSIRRLKDDTENVGADIAKDVAEKTNTKAGDGRTTALVLYGGIINEGIKYTFTESTNVMSIKKGIEKASNVAMDFLLKEAKPINTKEEYEHIAVVSSESDEIGKIIADTIEKVGEDGIVTVEESETIGIESDVTDGYEFDKGYISQFMITDGDRMDAEHKDVRVLVIDKTISNIDEMFSIISRLKNEGIPNAVLIVEDIRGLALNLVGLNRLKGVINLLAIRSPGYGERKKENLQDIALSVGAKIMGTELGTKIENMTQQEFMDSLGFADRIVSTQNTTVIVGGKGKKEDIDKQVEHLKKRKEIVENKFDLDHIQQRIAKLSGCAGVIKVGAATEKDTKYLKLKVEDAVNATKAAIDEGIVVGGGATLVRIAEKMKIVELESTDVDFVTGYNIVIKALTSPIRQMCKNSGTDGDESGVIINKILEGGEHSGYDFAKRVFVEDMLKAGITDPVKVTRIGVESACSGAAIFLTTEASIADDEPTDTE